ncbi:GrpB family protein [Nocardioides sp.]|uniref:GrpB family protein n=1 Tax=Nocardioides sp. TaxID=35761 RepID=UPI002CC6813A|nr:GrpB family protein [Nocardioides sp.]HXH79946.1 GrpB family protein [Nocardioides sp.]
MSVLVLPYSNSWPALFAEEAERLTSRLAPWLVGDIEHIGSTAVPGLGAKPILDMLAPVEDLDAARAARPSLVDLGYRHANHRPQEAMWFYKQQGEDYDTRTHQLHLTRPESALWRERLTFRDALRDDPALLIEYQDLKRALASSDDDLTEYTGGKREFVGRILLSKGINLG